MIHFCSTVTPQPCKKRLLIAYTEMLEYRVAVFEQLAEHYTLTVCHSGQRLTQNDRGFEEVVIPSRQLGRFRFRHLRASHQRWLSINTSRRPADFLSVRVGADLAVTEKGGRE